MDELLKMVQDKAGISPEQAQAAITTVMGFVKDKLPGPIADQLEGFLDGSDGDDDGGLMGKLGGLLGG